MLPVSAASRRSAAVRRAEVELERGAGQLPGGAAGRVGRQLQRRRWRAGVHAQPVRLVGVEPAGGLGAARPLGVLDVAHARQRRQLAPRIQRVQLVEQHPQRHPVDRDVVQVQQQPHAAAVPVQRGAQQRRRGQVERPYELRNRRRRAVHHPYVERGGGRGGRLGPLPHLPAHRHERGAQLLVPLDKRAERGRQPLRVDVSRQVDHDRLVVSHRRGVLELLDVQLVLLRRERVAPVGMWASQCSGV